MTNDAETLASTQYVQTVQVLMPHQRCNTHMVCMQSSFFRSVNLLWAARCQWHKLLCSCSNKLSSGQIYSLQHSAPETASDTAH
jgi:hypothetical protein